MNIEKHGVVPKNELNTEHFKCENCGCEFYANFDEYYIKKGSDFPRNNYDISSSVYVYKVTVTDNYICSCPECHKIVIKTKSRLKENPAITLTGTSSSSSSYTFVPDNCKNCSNHPSNGGSGNCNCALGSMGQITCSGTGVKS